MTCPSRFPASPAAALPGHFLGITRADNCLDLTDTTLISAAEPRPAKEIGRLRPKRSARIGVDYAGAWAGRLLRFYLAGNPHVSGKPRE